MLQVDLWKANDILPSCGKQVNRHGAGPAVVGVYQQHAVRYASSDVVSYVLNIGGRVSVKLQVDVDCIGDGLRRLSLLQPARRVRLHNFSIRKSLLIAQLPCKICQVSINRYAASQHTGLHLRT